jgi:hypothetical protein
MAQRRGTTIKQSAVSDVMSRLSELPDRGKDPGAVISLSKVLHTKEYFAEIKGALKKGYTFSDLAAIFSERCGVSISARQLKYHYTREKNKSAKHNAVGKPRQQDTSKDDATPENLARMSSSGEAEADAGDTGTVADVQAIHAPKHAAFILPNGVTCPAETGAFHFEKCQQGN